MTTASIHDPSPAVSSSRASTFGNVLRSEWTKARPVPSTVWPFLIAIVLGIGLGALYQCVGGTPICQGQSWQPGLMGPHIDQRRRPGDCAARYWCARCLAHHVGVLDACHRDKPGGRSDAAPGSWPPKPLWSLSSRLLLLSS